MGEILERAPYVVAKHFYDKYGHDKAAHMIAMRLEGVHLQKDAVFWHDVLNYLAKLSGPEPYVYQGTASATEAQSKDLLN